MVECNDSTIYTGSTNDVDKRIEAHNNGAGAKYTKTRRPVSLVYLEQYDNRSQACSREYELKKLSRKRKLELIGEYG